MIDIVIQHASDPGHEEQLCHELLAHEAAVRSSGGRGNRSQVDAIEAKMVADPFGCFVFDARGHGTLTAAGHTYAAGRFEIPTIASLRQRALARDRSSEKGRVRLWVLDGVSPATDIGSLQATANPGTLFQVASQFNCLESPGPFVTPIARYFSDPTQGPRASISAFPGTFLRHYAAPDDSGNRFVQTTHGRQLNLLEAVCSPGVARVRSGYLTSADLPDPAAFASSLEGQFEEIRVGVHDDVPVLLGYNWDGAVSGDRLIGQVFTSTFAGGGYSGPNQDDVLIRRICTLLLRAGYLGTLLAAVALGRHKVVLTLIGGGVFGNPIPLIWESLLWAIDETENLQSAGLEVVVNGRTLRKVLPLEKLLPAVRARGGIVVEFDAGTVSLRR